MTLASAATNPSDNLQLSWNLLGSDWHTHQHEKREKLANQRVYSTPGGIFVSMNRGVSYPHCARLPQNLLSLWEQAIWRSHTWLLIRLSVDKNINGQIWLQNVFIAMNQLFPVDLFSESVWLSTLTVGFHLNSSLK